MGIPANSLRFPAFPIPPQTKWHSTHCCKVLLAFVHIIYLYPCGSGHHPSFRCLHLPGVPVCSQHSGSANHRPVLGAVFVEALRCNSHQCVNSWLLTQLWIQHVKSTAVSDSGPQQLPTKPHLARALIRVLQNDCNYPL